MVRLVTLFLAILVLILEVHAYTQEDVYKLFKIRNSICHQPPKRGNCSYMDVVDAFYYKHTTQKCEVFRYSGCGGNSNRFRTKVRCIEFCIDYKYLIPKIFRQ